MHHQIPSDPDFVEEDEIHLVDPDASREPVIDLKVVFWTFLDVFFIIVSLGYLFQNGFNPTGILLALLSAVIFVVNMRILMPLFRKIRDRSIMYGRPEEFRDYADQVNQANEKIHEKVAPDYRFKFWRGGNRAEYV
uniref:Uncharacterized protein n=1 Tax=Panagrolaimus sp. JU765 TaxID=591449 RepID=A0AC34QDT0_9BILA